MGFLKSLINPRPQPDFYFAAKGYVHVATMRRLGKDETYLRALERGIGLDFLNEGCDEDQALSARWGGCLAIEDDLILFELGIKNGREESAQLGYLPAADPEVGKETYRKIYQAAGDFATRCAWEHDRSIYRRFLNFIDK